MAVNWTSGLLSGYGLYDQLDRLSNIADKAVEGTNELADQAVAGTTFKPFTVTTGTGTTAVDPTGGFSTSLNPTLQAIQQQAYTGAQDAMGGTAGDPYLQGLLSDFRAGQTDPRMYTGIADTKSDAFGAAGQFTSGAMTPTDQREMDIYERIRAAQMPEEERARSDLESRLFSQGRLGMGSSAYGSTPEQFALEKAIAEARNSAMLGAMGQAQSEMMNQGNLANTFGRLGLSGAQLQQGLASQNVNDILGISQANLQNRLGLADLGQGLLSTGMLPEAQLLNQLGLGTNLANLAQTGQIAGTNLASQLGLGGLQTSLNADVARANLLGNAIGSLSGNLSGTDFDPVGGAIDWLKDVLGI